VNQNHATGGALTVDRRVPRSPQHLDRFDIFERDIIEPRRPWSDQLRVILTRINAHVIEEDKRRRIGQERLETGEADTSATPIQTGSGDHQQPRDLGEQDVAHGTGDTVTHDGGDVDGVAIENRGSRGRGAVSPLLTEQQRWRNQQRQKTTDCSSALLA